MLLCTILVSTYGSVQQKYANRLPGLEPQLNGDQIKLLIFESFPVKWQHAFIQSGRCIANEPLAKVVQYMKDEKSFLDITTRKREEEMIMLEIVMAIGDDPLDLIKVEAEIAVAEAVDATEATIVTCANIMEAMTGPISSTIQMVRTICPIGGVMETEVFSEDEDNGAEAVVIVIIMMEAEIIIATIMVLVIRTNKKKASNSGESTLSSRTNNNNNLA